MGSWLVCIRYATGYRPLQMFLKIFYESPDAAALGDFFCESGRIFTIIVRWRNPPPAATMALR